MKTVLGFMILSLTFSALGNTSLVSKAKATSAVKAILLASAVEAQMPLSKCTTIDVKTEGDAADGSVSFTVICSNNKIEYGVMPKIEGYFFGGKFFIQSISINRAG